MRALGPCIHMYIHMYVGKLSRRIPYSFFFFFLVFKVDNVTSAKFHNSQVP